MISAQWKYVCRPDKQSINTFIHIKKVYYFTRRRKKPLRRPSSISSELYASHRKAGRSVPLAVRRPSQNFAMVLNGVWVWLGVVVLLMRKDVLCDIRIKVVQHETWAQQSCSGSVVKTTIWLPPRCIEFGVGAISGRVRHEVVKDVFAKVFGVGLPSWSGSLFNLVSKHDQHFECHLLVRRQFKPTFSTSTVSSPSCSANWGTSSLNPGIVADNAL